MDIGTTLAFCLAIGVTNGFTAPFVLKSGWKGSIAVGVLTSVICFGLHMIGYFCFGLFSI